VVPETTYQAGYEAAEHFVFYPAFCRYVAEIGSMPFTACNLNCSAVQVCIHVDITTKLR
jgi:hypothetical protein